MVVKSSKEVMFFFGSGADTDTCCNLPSGGEFVENLLRNSYTEERKNLLKDIGRFSLIDKKSTSVFIQTINVYQNKAKDILGNEKVQKFVDYYQNGEQKYKNDVSAMCEQFVVEIKNNSESKIAHFFLENAVFFDSLDEKFNSLRNSEHLNASAKKVINAYWIVYIQLFKKLYKIDDKEKFIENFDSIFNLLKENYKIDCEKKDVIDQNFCKKRLICNKICNKKESYYGILKESGIECHIVTTNYTEVAEKILNREDIVYLHGKMTWFEDLTTLRVYDCTNNNERKRLEKAEHIIPFILIPSGVKPLICKRQVKSFNAFVAGLEDTNILCIVGYRFNSEDNHINSIIGEWLSESEKHKIFFLNFNKSVNFDDLTWIDKEITIKESKSFSDLDKCQILNYIIPKSDNSKKEARAAFREFLDWVKKENKNEKN